MAACIFFLMFRYAQNSIDVIFVYVDLGDAMIRHKWMRFI